MSLTRAGRIVLERFTAMTGCLDLRLLVLVLVLCELILVVLRIAEGFDVMMLPMMKRRDKELERVWCVCNERYTFV